jgi:hypothetical protein
MKIKTVLVIVAANLLCGFITQTVRAQDINTFAPAVVKTMPEAGTTNVPPGEYEVKITFSKEMADQSWSWASAWQNSDPAALDKPHYDADRKTCVMKVKLEPGKTYGWWINSQNFHGFRDAQNNPAIPYLLTFKTSEK